VLDFLKNNYFLVFYAIAMVLSVIKYRRYFDSVLKYLPIIIAYTLLTEILGFLIRDVEEFQLIYEEGYSYYNQLIFNILDIIFFLYFYYVFWSTTQRIGNRKFIKYGALIFIIACFANPYFQDITVFPQLYAIISGSIVLIIAVILYLKETGVKKERLLFWISLGLLAFYTFYPMIMSIGLINYDLYETFQLKHLHRILIVIMYCCFIIGFMRMKRFKLA